MSQTRRKALLGAASLALAAGIPAAARGAPAAGLRVVRRVIEVKGRAATVFGIEGVAGTRGLWLARGDRFRVRLGNDSGTATLVHWHGLTPLIDQDGVPGLSQPVLAPGQSYDYDFVNLRGGTHWMHSHVGLQEQSLLAAPLIVREDDEPDHVVLLHDFTFRDPQDILDELQRGGGGHAGHHMGTGDMSNMGMPGINAMLNDVAFDAFLANDRTLDDPEVVSVEPGQSLRLRIINGAAASNMWIDLGPLSGELVAVDGNAIVPLKGSVFPLAIAQRADIRVVVPKGPGAYPVLFRPEGLTRRTGIVLAAGKVELVRQSEEGDLAPALDLTFESQYRPLVAEAREPVTVSAMVMLTGGGGDYQWGFNGKPSMHDSLLTVRAGDRAEVVLHNMTMMAHPMHLHGHHFKVVALNRLAVDGALRDTILVPPMQSVTIQFSADNPGVWAFHCHHLYHMNSGMMGTLNYTSAA